VEPASSSVELPMVAQMRLQGFFQVAFQVALQALSDFMNESCGFACICNGANIISMLIGFWILS